MKKARLFYYEEGCDAWVPVPDNYIAADLLPDFESMDNNEEVTIRFKRIDMTDEEFEALPEA